MSTHHRYPEEIRADAIERCRRAHLMRAVAACNDRPMLQEALDYEADHDGRACVLAVKEHSR